METKAHAYGNTGPPLYLLWGTGGQGPRLRRHHAGPLPECREVPCHPGTDPLAEGLRHRRHPVREQGHGLFVRHARPWHQQCVQRCPLKGCPPVAGEAGKRVPRRTPLDPPSRQAEGCVTSQERVYRPLRSCIGSCMIWVSRWFLRAYTSSPIWTMSSTKSLALAGPRDDAARTAANSRFRSPGTTPAIRDSVHLQPCSLHATNSTALSVKGSSAVNSSTRLHRSPATSSSRAHSRSCGQCRGAWYHGEKP